jgi:hypothetical protein
LQLCMKLLSWFLLALIPFCVHAQSASSGTVPFVLDGNRVYARVEFILPHGKPRDALVFVDLGSPAVTLSKKLYADLNLGSKKTLGLRVRFDYAGQTMTLAQPATLQMRGTLVPFRLNPKTGLICAGMVYAAPGLAARHRRVTGVQLGDKLVQIGSLPAHGARREAIFAAMHGKAGEIRSLVLERAGGRVRVQTRATGF